jgi:Mce-associated membrane protein
VAGAARRSAVGEGRRPLAEVSSRPAAGAQPPSGEAEEPQAPEKPEENPEPDDRGRQRLSTRRRTLVVRALIGLLVVSLLVAGGFGLGLYNLGHGQTTGNAALSDRAETQQVTAQVGQAVRTSFTYDYANPQRTEQEAAKVLTGPAIRQYRQLFGQVEQVAPAQKLVFTTNVRSAGVQELRGDHARVLLFVDQQGVRADNDQRRSGSAQLDVTAQRIGDQWKVSDIRVL